MPPLANAADELSRRIQNSLTAQRGAPGATQPGARALARHSIRHHRPRLRGPAVVPSQLSAFNSQLLIWSGWRPSQPFPTPNWNATRRNWRPAARHLTIGIARSGSGSAPVRDWGGIAGSGRGLGNAEAAPGGGRFAGRNERSAENWARGAADEAGLRRAVPGARPVFWGGRARLCWTRFAPWTSAGWRGGWANSIQPRRRLCWRRCANSSRTERKPVCRSN